MAPDDLAQSLDKFIARALQKHRDQTGEFPLMAFDPAWPSPCLCSSDSAPGVMTAWQPVRQDPPSDMFDRLENALEFSLHPDIRTWYTRYWSDPLPARHPDGELSLLFCWNSDDMERLRGNLLGHLLAKQKQKLPPTLFFACTEGDEFMTLNNEDGTIWLERPGRKPLRCLANSLADFLAQLEPLPISAQE